MKRGVLAVVLVVAAGLYVLEQYVLRGTALVPSATATISAINPRPGVTIPVMQAGSNVRVYMKAADDLELTYTLVSPGEMILREETVSLGRESFSFEAEQRGSYLLVLSSSTGQGRVTLTAWANDRRLFYGLMF
jgi:hypothetical protein